MPTDNAIALGVQSPQFKTLDPMTIYQAMQDQRVNALREQMYQQEMAKNAMTMQNTMEDRRIAAATRAQAAAQAAEERRRLAEYRGVVGQFGTTDAAVGQRGVGYSGTGVSNDPYAFVRNQLVRGGFVPQAEELAKVQKEQLAGEESKAKIPGLVSESAKKGIETVDAQLKQLNLGLERAASPEEVDALFDGSADAIRATGKTPEMSKAAFRQLAERVGFDNAKMQVAQGIMATQKHLNDMFVAQKPELKNISGVGMTAINPYTGEGKRVTIDGEPIPTTTSEVPELKKGEVWNAEKQRVDAAKGSDTYIAQSQKHGKDYGAVNYLGLKTQFANETIDRILSDENKKAFENNFGGYEAYVTRKLPGETQRVGADLEQLKSEMVNAGLDMIRQGGSIGQMTEREWPMIEKTLGAINPTLEAEDARKLLREVKARLTRILDTAKETYQTEWGETQYYKQPSNANPFDGYVIKEKGK